MRRLFLFQLGTTLATLDGKLPTALPRELRRPLVLRILDEAFGLADPDPAALPRDKAAFTARATAGKARVNDVQIQLVRLATDLETELGKVRAMLKPLAGKPGIIRAVVEDVQSQLAHLSPPELLRTASLARLGHVLRYIKAVLVRLQRQAHDPQKDQQKAVQVTPLWQSFVARRDELRAAGRSAKELEEAHWLVEELRVQVFAPELKTAVPVSAARVQEVLRALG